MLPKRPLNELDLITFAKDLPHFRGVFMRNELPTKPHKNECGIVNLQTSQENGSHWVAYFRKQFQSQQGQGSRTLYYDSFGNLKPPKELIAYLGNNIQYNFEQYQDYNTVICGHLCLIFLYMCNSKQINFDNF